MNYDTKFSIGEHTIALDAPSYFVADIAANHDGNLSRAKDLICLAKESGANAVKFQHFLADKIVSDYGFKHLGQKMSHQSKWKKNVYETYKEYECDRTWTETLVKTAKETHIDFLSTPYDDEAVRMLEPHVSAYKIGSGDITWTDFIAKIAKLGKPVLLATGASSMQDVERAVETILANNRKICLMQCNTNYTGCGENLKYINLNVLKTYAHQYPGMLLGLSDHTPGYTTVLGAISLGARIIEKHFTDDAGRKGPDHIFSMTPKTWQEMINRSRELEESLGNGQKIIETNEEDTVIVQRRCLRLIRDMKAGEVITHKDLVSLRPAPENSVAPYELTNVIGKKISSPKTEGDALYWKDIND